MATFSLPRDDESMKQVMMGYLGAGRRRACVVDRVRVTGWSEQGPLSASCEAI